MADSKGNRDIFIICDLEGDDSHEHFLQMTSKGRQLADQLSCKVYVVCLNRYSSEQLAELIRHGAHQVLVCVTGDINMCEVETSVDSYCEILNDLFHKVNPSVVLYPASETGRHIAATLSFRLSAGLTAECIEIDIDTQDGKVAFFRAAMNDTVIAKIKCINCEINMCTVKKDVFKRQVYNDAADAKEYIRYVDYTQMNKENRSIIKVLETFRHEVKDAVDISKSTIVFCIGRGVGNAQTLSRVYALARKCGAEIVGTRAVVEDKVMGKERQVGQSGNSIAPELYVGFGVSGASQHMVGIRNAGTIIAVNSDKNAAIFQYADYAIVEDVDRFVTAMESMVSAEAVLAPS